MDACLSLSLQTLTIGFLIGAALVGFTWLLTGLEGRNRKERDGDPCDERD